MRAYKWKLSLKAVRVLGEVFRTELHVAKAPIGMWEAFMAPNLKLELVLSNCEMGDLASVHPLRIRGSFLLGRLEFVGRMEKPTAVRHLTDHVRVHYGIGSIDVSINHLYDELHLLL